MDAYFINMESAQERRVKFENIVNDLHIELAINRFSALTDNGINGSLTSGEKGCFLSHAHILNVCDQSSNVFIFEDDAILTNSLKRLIPVLNSNHDFDIIFLNGGISPLNSPKLIQLLKLKSTTKNIYEEDFVDFKLYNAIDLYVHSMSAYMLTPRGISKLKDYYNLELSSGQLNFPVDLFLKQLMFTGKISGAVIFPFLTGIDHNSPTQIINRASSNQAATNDACSNLFVADFKLFNDLKIYVLESFFSNQNNLDSLIASRLFYEGIYSEVNS